MLAQGSFTDAAPFLTGAPMAELVASLVICVLALGLVLLWSRKHERSAGPPLVLFAVLLLAGLLLYSPGSWLYQAGDGEYYRDWAIDIAAGESVSTIWPDKGVWSLMISPLFFSLGPVWFPVIAINVSLCVFALVLVHEAAIVLGYRGSWGPFFLLATSVGFIYYGPSLLREPIWWFGLSLCVLGVTLLSSAPKRGWVLLLLGAVVVLAIRPDVGIVLVATILGSLIVVNFFQKPPSLRSFGLAAAQGAALVGTFSLFYPLLSGVTSAEKAQTVRDGLSDESVTTRVSVVPVHSAPSEPESILVGLSEFLLSAAGPLWWEVGGSFPLLVAAVSSAHFLLVLGLAIIGLSREKSRAPSAALLLAGGIMWVVLSAVLGNYGAVIRFRQLVEIIFLPVALLGLSPALRGSATIYEKMKNVVRPNPAG